jgi:SAM-dependent methyltransferase
MENTQSAYHIGHTARSSVIDEAVYDACYLYLTGDLGIDNATARQRADLELSRKIQKSVVEELAAGGISVADSVVLDLGSGLGAMSEELVLCGANVTALEPGAAWAKITRERVERHKGEFRLIEAVGESVPLPDGSVDLVVSLQVLEHVNSPRRVLSEVWRVLRPGGHFYLACENYLAFHEGHYQVPWLPLLPKSLGAIYLRFLGRSPKFLYDAVTYVTYPGILRECRMLGFVRSRDEQLSINLRSKSGFKWALLRLLGESNALTIDRAKVAFKFGVYEMFRKPHIS